MNDSTTDISNHYTVTGLGDRILAALAAAGKDIDALEVDDLAPVDEFHIRGRMATEELASWAQIGSSDRVLDVGCGLGGTSRHLAASTGCELPAGQRAGPAVRGRPLRRRLDGARPDEHP